MAISGHSESTPKKDYFIEGMSTFSIQDPITRNYTYEWLFIQNLKFEDVLAPNYFFVNVNINGKEKGIYAIEEHFSKEMIEGKKEERELYYPLMSIICGTYTGM